MKCLVTLLCCAVTSAGTLQAFQGKGAPKKKSGGAAEQPLPFKTLKENISYGIGLNFGTNVLQTLQRSLQFVEYDRKQLAKVLKIDKQLMARFEQDGLAIDRVRIQEGFQDALSGAKPKLTDKHLKQLFAEARKQMQQHQQQQAAKNKKAGEAFLADNKKKAGVVTTKSGLQYKIIRRGTGKRPGAKDLVVAHYVGTLIDKSEFDSSRKRGMPATFPVNRVIKGWTEALQLMRVGAKWHLFIPPHLGYGETARPGIPANSVLIFEVELLGIREAPKERRQSPNPPR